jgi:hypothetical protein
MKVVVVYRKRLNAKPEIAVFDDVNVDDIINSKKRKPIIPNEWLIDEVGVGESFIDYYSKKLKIKITEKSYNPIF